MSPDFELVLGEVRREMQRAKDEHGPLSTDPLRALRVLVEEVGEVADAISETGTDGEAHLAQELRQVAATAMIWLENLESFKNKPRPVKKENTKP